MRASLANREEVMNWLTHGLGLLMSIIGLILLLVKAGGQSLQMTASVIVYGLTMIAVYASSTIYHYVKAPTKKKLWKILDHAAIYLLIAGTYTPFALVTLSQGIGYTVFFIAWSLALSGVIFKIFFTGRFVKLSTLLYIAMGWMSCLLIQPLMSSLAWEGFILLMGGGLVYTLGTIFYLAKKIPYSHAIWHLFVMGGSVMHFLSVFYYVLPKVA